MLDDKIGDAILAFTHLLILYSFAPDDQDESLLLVNERRMSIIPSWLHFLRAGCSMLCDVWDKLESGPLKSLALAWETAVEIDEARETSSLTTFSA